MCIFLLSSSAFETYLQPLTIHVHAVAAAIHLDHSDQR